MRAGLGAFLKGLFVREQAPEVMPSGLLRWGRMDERFRERCAVWADGRVMIAEGFVGDLEVRDVLAELQRSGALPDVLRESTGTLLQVAEVWRGNRVEGDVLEVNPRVVEGLVSIFTEALKAEASDVVFQKGQDDCRVFAIVNDRKFQIGNPIPVRDANQAYGFLFFVKDEGSRHTSLQRDRFQGFSIRPSERFPLPKEISALRCQAGPYEPDGHGLFIRVFRGGQVKDKTLESLGHTPEVAAIFREIRMSKFGGIFIGGKTGDGKSTSLVVNLNLQMREHKGQLNMVTLEDPVENEIDGAVQIAVSGKGTGREREQHFEEALMHFVRVHPASGMVGEIRDRMSARQVLQFIDSGHQIWTTIHVHSANGILFRLMDLGVTEAEVTKRGNVRILMKQTLVSMLCPKCAKPEKSQGAEVPEELLKLLGPGVRYRDPKGCKACRKAGASDLWLEAWSGYARPIAVAEWIVPDDGYLRFVGKRDAIGAWNYWVNDMGGVPIGHKVWRAVAEGRVDPEDALLKGVEIAEAEEALSGTAARPRLVWGEGEAVE